MADETQVTLNESVMPVKEGQVDVSNVDIVVDGKAVPNDTDTPESTPEEETQETTTEVEAPVENPVETQKETEKVIKEELETKGLSFDEFAEEYQSNGSLSPESINKLEQAGYPKAMVDAYITGLEAQANKFVDTVKSYSDGKWDNIVELVKSQGQEAIDGFNATLNTGNLSQIKLMINGLLAQHKTQFGTSNPLVTGMPTATTNQAGFTSKQEMVSAMADKRYGRDMSYTREVQTKVKMSNIFG